MVRFVSNQHNSDIYLIHMSILQGKLQFLLSLYLEFLESLLVAEYFVHIKLFATRPTFPR